MLYGLKLGENNLPYKYQRNPDYSSWSITAPFHLGQMKDGTSTFQTVIDPLQTSQGRQANTVDGGAHENKTAYIQIVSSMSKNRRFMTPRIRKEQGVINAG